MRLPEHKGKGTGEEQAVFQPDVENRKEQRSDVVCIRTSGRRCDRSMRNKCLFALGVVFAMSLTSIVAFAFSFTGEPDVKNDLSVWSLSSNTHPANPYKIRACGDFFCPLTKH